MNFLRNAVITVAMLPALAMAQAQVCTNGGDLIFEQPPNQVNGIFSDADCDFCGSGVQVIADDFVLSASANIGEIQMYGGYFPTNVPSDPDDFTVIFHENAAGIPGTSISTEASVASSKTDTGVDLFGVDEYLFTLSLNKAVFLTPGHYWVEIYNNTADTTESFFWETGDVSPVGGVINGAFTFEAPGANWNIVTGVDFAFSMCSTPSVPIPTLGRPALFVLFTLFGLFGLATLSRRRYYW